MIEHVHRRVALSPALDDVVVATCDSEIAGVVESFGGTAVMTADTHERASDRVAEAAQSIDADVIVMVQGDEPMTTPDAVEQALSPFAKDSSVRCVNLIARLTTEAELADPNTIKVVKDTHDRALYFSREAIPTPRVVGIDRIEAWKQVCVIPFRRDALLEFAALEPTPLEIAESIDMMRFLEHARPVQLVETDSTSQAVDTPDDLVEVERLMRDDPLLARY